MNTVEPIEVVLNLWHQGIGAAEIGRRFGRSRDWTRGIVRRAAAAGDAQARPHRSGNIIGAERTGYQPETRRFYYEKERSSDL